MTPNEILTARKKKAKILKDQRLKKGITKAELMRRSGLSRFTIDHLESGAWNFSIDTQTLYQNALKKQTV
jgi:transcriptional regulator with XRE-family HTH domain